MRRLLSFHTAATKADFLTSLPADLTGRPDASNERFFLELARALGEEPRTLSSVAVATPAAPTSTTSSMPFSLIQKPVPDTLSFADAARWLLAYKYAENVIDGFEDACREALLAKIDESFKFGGYSFIKTKPRTPTPKIEVRAADRLPLFVGLMNALPTDELRMKLFDYFRPSWSTFGSTELADFFDIEKKGDGATSVQVTADVATAASYMASEAVSITTPAAPGATPEELAAQLIFVKEARRAEFDAAVAKLKTILLTTYAMLSDEEQLRNKSIVFDTEYSNRVNIIDPREFELKPGASILKAWEHALEILPSKEQHNPRIREWLVSIPSIGKLSEMREAGLEVAAAALEPFTSIPPAHPGLQIRAAKA
jgi:hypothetical protein